MSQQPIQITETEIYINAQYFCRRDNSCAFKDVLADVFARQYAGQTIKIYAGDGENLIASGLLNLMCEFCSILNIPFESVVVETHDTALTQPFIFTHLPLGIFLGANKFIPEFKQDLSKAKFVGLAVGRFMLERMYTAYSLAQAFPDDNYMIFQSKDWADESKFANLYEKELKWFHNYQFDQDLIGSSRVGAVGFDTAYQNYPNIWNQYQIEIVIETDPVSSFWFTEKTAKCLATGKPFLLVAGHGSLARLKNMGFETFDSVIDESYDNEFLPTKRIDAIVNSLKDLYNNNCSEKIEKMYEIAKRNQEHYKQYVKDQGH